MQDRAKRYSNIKYSLSIFGVFYALVLIFLFLRLGLSRNLSLWLYSSLPGSLVFPSYLALAFLGYYLLSLPLNFYQSYTLEHKFRLSSQKAGDWFTDQLKSGAVSYLIALILVFVFYSSLNSFPGSWWVFISVFWIFFSVIMAKVMPVVIIPLFFKYKKITDEALRERIVHLAGKMKVKLIDCFEIDFSKKTVKANAAFVGIGNTKRVILADTLKDRYSHDEIEVILAHEFAHYRLKHLLKLIIVNSFSTFVIFYLLFRTSPYFLSFFGFSSLNELGALPVALIYFMVFGVILQPIEAFLSRSFERSADREALKVTGLKSAFVSMINKLAEQNLADRDPHPVIKFFFFDHPPIGERIRASSIVNS